MRVIIAGAHPTDVATLMQSLRRLLPPDISCVCWDSTLSLSGTNDVVLLLAVTRHTAMDPMASDHNDAHVAADQVLRYQLMQSGVSFQVIYADAHQLLQPVRHAVAKALSQHNPRLAETWMREEREPAWQGLCDACSDPDCEHRLFGRLLKANTSLE